MNADRFPRLPPSVPPAHYLRRRRPRRGEIPGLFLVLLLLGVAYRSLLHRSGAAEPIHWNFYFPSAAGTPATATPAADHRHITSIYGSNIPPRMLEQGLQGTGLPFRIVPRKEQAEVVLRGVSNPPNPVYQPASFTLRFLSGGQIEIPVSPITPGEIQRPFAPLANLARLPRSGASMFPPFLPERHYDALTFAAEATMNLGNLADHESLSRVAAAAPAVRLVPEVAVLRPGERAEFDFQFLTSDQRWASITNRSDVTFRLVDPASPGATGLEQLLVPHRTAKGSFAEPFDSRQSGRRILVEARLDSPEFPGLVQRSLVIL